MLHTLTPGKTRTFPIRLSICGGPPGAFSRLTETAPLGDLEEYLGRSMY